MDSNIANVEMAAAWDGPEGEHWATYAEYYESTNSTCWQTLMQRVHVADTANVVDVATSSFGAMFFVDPIAAFANIARALRPGGQVALLVWRELARNEWVTAIREALAVGRALPEPPPDAPGPFGFARRDHVAHVLTSAGLVDVGFEGLDEPIRLGSDPDDAFSFVSTLGITRGLTQDLDEADRAAALAALERVLTEHDSTDGVSFRGSAWLITARSATSDG